MATRFDGDFSTGDFTQFSDGETDVNTLGALVADAADDFDSSYFYRVSHDGVSAREAYAKEETEFAHQAKSVRGRFRFRMDDTNVFNGGKSIGLIKCDGGSVLEFALIARSVGGGELEELQVRYRNAAGSSVLDDIRTLPSQLQDDTVHLFEFHFAAPPPLDAGSGIARVWVDGAEVGTGTGLDIGTSRYITSLQFGMYSTDVIVVRQMDFADFKLSINAEYTAGFDSYYVDPINGSDLNLGTAASPFKTTLQALEARPGEKVVIVDPRDTSTPIRTADVGPVVTRRDGTAAAGIAIEGTASGAHTTILGTKSYPPASWTGPDGAGEYEIDISADTTVDPKRLYVCLESDWLSLGYKAIDPRQVGFAPVRATAGSVGTLGLGEYNYTANVIHYKPSGSETFADLHIEIPVATITSDIVDCEHDYTTIRYIDAIFPVEAGILASGTGTGSVVIECSGVSFRTFGIATSSAADIVNCVGSWSINIGSAAGDGIHGANGTGAVLGCTAHDNANDGISFAGTHSAIIAGNICHSNGYAGTGNEYGIEITASAVAKCYQNTLVGNFSGGFVNQSDATVGQVCTDNISAYNSGSGFKISAEHAESVLDGNASYGNAGLAFTKVGTGSITPSDIITTDPLFAKVATSSVWYQDRSEDDYELQSGSPCVGVASKWWAGVRPASASGEPYPDVNADKGGLQSTRSVTHPANL